MPSYDINRGQSQGIPPEVTSIFVQKIVSGRVQYSLRPNGPTGVILNNGEEHQVSVDDNNQIKNVTPTGIGGQDATIRVRW